MKKTILNSAIYLILLSNLCADNTSNLLTYSKIECRFEEEVKTDRNYKHSHHHHHSSTTTVAPSRAPRPNIHIEQGCSNNWSGYVSMTDIHNPALGSVSFVSGTWIVPQLLPTPDTSYTAIWVGIDGYASPSVEQLGTEHVWINGAQQNIAWYEMYPNPAYQIDGFPVSVGDVIEAAVTYTGSNQFQLKIINHTQNVYTVIPANLTQSSTANRNSAEWIVEAPYSSGILPLSDFQTITFSNCKAVINNTNGSIADGSWQADDLTMVSSIGVTKATPSNLSSDYESFTVSWSHE